MTRTHVRLLGPCFKTGRVERRHGLTPRGEADDPCEPPAAPATLVTPSQGRQEMSPGVSPAALGPPPRERGDGRNDGVPIHPGLGRPRATGRGDLLRGEIRPSTNGDGKAACPREIIPWVTLRNSSTDQPSPSRRAESPQFDLRVPPVWLLTVSRALELSLQSSFQLSLTVLVRYRSRGHI